MGFCNFYLGSREVFDENICVDVNDIKFKHFVVRVLLKEINH